MSFAVPCVFEVLLKENEMPISCPKCGVVNPLGAETCGECGCILDSTPLSVLSASARANQPSPLPSQPLKENKNFSAGGNEGLSEEEDFEAKSPEIGNKGLPSTDRKGLTGTSILSVRETRKAPVQAQILAGVLWVTSAAMIALSIFLLKPSKSIVLPIPLLPLDFPYRLRVIYAIPIMAAGIYTLITAYGISNLKRWGVKVYTSWVMVQVILEILARIYHHQLGAVFSVVVLVELVFILFLWQIKYRFLY